MKKIISLLLILMVAMGFMTSVNAEDSDFVFDIYALSTRSDSESCHVEAEIENLTSADKTGIFVVASYTEEGQFLNHAYKDISIPANDYDTYTVTVDSVPTGFQKAFILDSWNNFAPLAETRKMARMVQYLDADTYYPQGYITESYQFSNSNKIRFDSTYYKLGSESGEGKGIDLYVNSDLYATINASDAGIADTLDRILGNATGTIGLFKGDNSNYYSEIHLEYYQIARVTSVAIYSDRTEISLGASGAPIDGMGAFFADKITIYNDAVSEGNTSVSVTRNGEKADLASLVKGDIIAYATDFTCVDSSKIEDPVSIDIIATNKTISGTVTRIDTTEGIYTIDSAQYKKVPGTSNSALAIGNAVILTLDPFGRIFATKIDASAIPYAIALKENSDDTVKLLLTDGTTKSFEYRPSATPLDSSVFATTSATDRVVTYNIQSSTSKISGISLVTGRVYADEVYDSRSGKLAGAVITDTTPIIYAPESEFVSASVAKNPECYRFLSKADLSDDVTYDLTTYKTGTYVNLVVITKIGNFINESSRFAVVSSYAYPALTEEGDTVDAIDVLYAGEEQRLMLAPGVLKKYGLAMGDAFFFTTDSDGYINTVYKVYDKSSNFTSLPDAIESNVLAENPDATQDEIAEVIDRTIDTSYHVWGFNIWDDRCDIVLAEGVVYAVNYYMSFASKTQIEKNELDATGYLSMTDGDGIIDYYISDECVAYVYDKNAEAKEVLKYSATDPYSIKASDFSEFDIGNGILNDDIFAGTDTLKMADYANHALAMIVDGQIVAIYVIEL